MTSNVDAQLEEYCFLRHCSNDLLAARQRLDVALKQQDQSILFALLEGAVVVYARPFSGTRGKHKRKYLLAKAFVPAASATLHKELIRLRNELFAHTDVAHHDSKMMGHGALLLMTRKIADFASLSHRASDIGALFRDVEMNVNAKLAELQAEPWMAAARQQGKLEVTLSLGTIDLAGRPPGKYLSPIVIDLGPGVRSTGNGGS